MGIPSPVNGVASAILGTFEVALPCALICPANVTVSNSPGLCGAAVNYTIDQGTCVGYTLTPNLPSGSVFPVGTTTVVASSGTASCSFSVTVNDVEPPTFAPCPADIIVNLDPGACAAFVQCNVKAVDNCPYAGPLQSLVQYNSTAIDMAGALACYIAPTSYWRVYNLNAMGVTTDFLIQSVTTAIVNANNTPFTARLYQLNGAFTLANLTLLGQKTVNLTGNGIYGTIPFDAPIQITAGSTFVVELALLPVAPFGPAGQNQSGEAFPSYISAPSCGITQPQTFASIGFAYVGLFHPNGNVYIDEIPLTNNSEINPATGLPYECGDEFPIGTVGMTFTATDAAGLTANCSYNITVLEFPNPTQTMACNDNVQISLDQTGCVEILADMILEGGPYHCYDDYIVEVLNQFGFPTGNQVCCSDVGKTKTVRVTDPDTGNKCWGSVKIEDKLKPIIECADLSISCTEDIENLPSPQIPGVFEEVIEGLNDVIENNTSPLEYTFDLSYLPAGHPVLDVNVRVKLIDHTWIPDLNMFVINPAGQSVSFFTVAGCAGLNLNVDAWFDDEGAGTPGAGSTCTFFDAAGAPILPYVAGVQQNNVLTQLDGSSASGTWTVRITDSFAGDDGVVKIIGLHVETPDLAQVDPYDNCAIADLSFTESVTNGTCSGPSQTIIRVWTATDPSGNKASCTQTITRVRPTLADIEVPPSYDGINNPALDCSGNGWDTNGNGYPDPSETGGITITGNPFVNEDICEMTATYQDIVIPICAGTFKVVRKWLIIDWCLIEQMTYDQVIKVADQTGPTVVCPTAPKTINVYQASYNQGGPHSICKGNVVIPALVVSGDDCSGLNPAGYKTELWTLGAGTLLQSINGNGGTFPNVELIADNPPTNNAQYTVRHIFTDGCGNQSECIYNITVIDKVPPVPICDEITELALTNNGGSGQGCSILPAKNLDDGSYDNCGDVFFYAAKMNPFLTPPYFYQYYKTLEYCCDEVGDNMVIVLVLDFDPTTVPGATLPDGSVFLFPGNPIFEGSFNTCMVTVGVTDKIPPVTLFCPANQTINCDTYLNTYAAGVSQGNYSVLAGFGFPQFYDNCDYNEVYTVTVNLNNCTEGSITRKWTASDANGQASCTQTITVTHKSDWVVEFPADFTGQCTNGQLPNTGEPKIFHDECELIGVSHADQLFTIVPDACYKIVRTWNVINWCIYDDFGYDAYLETGKAECNLNQDWDGDGDKDCRTFRDGYNSTGSPGTPDGYISYKQVIKVIDNEAPSFTIPPIDGCITDTDCNTNITLPYPDINDDCSLAFDVDITGDFGSFNNITGAVTIPNVNVGEYDVTYAVTDNCGNTGYHTITVVVEDCKKPTPLCDNGLVVEIMQTGMVEVWADAFDEGSFDNCGPITSFSFSPDVTDLSHIYTCDDLGQQPVQIWVTDIYGNQDYCETFVVVQDNMFSCNSVTIAVAGAIATEGQVGVEGVNVEINGGLFASFTDNNGNFSFNALTSGGDYTVAPELDQNPSNGVTTWDLVLISRHILGIQLLNSPYKMIAADANKSNSVTTLDMVNIRKVILQIEPGFPNNTSWRFVNKDYVFPNPANPFAATFPEVINYNNMSSSDLNADFVAVKVGDVNGSAAANLTGNVEDRTFNGSMNIDVQDQQLKAGKTYTVDFTAQAIDLLGYQFTLNYNTQAVEIQNLAAGVAGEENFGMLLEEGVLTTSWNVSEARALAQGEVLFSLVVKANADVALSEVFGVSSAYTAAEAYNGNSELLDVNLMFNGTEATGFALYQNVPNPFKGETVIGFTLPEASTATLTVMDVSGKVLATVAGEYAKGYNEVRLGSGETSFATGVLYYQLDTPTHSATKKMVIIE
ncbi:MAG: HYR domain-containing protein [Saprospirales bacterium]|nr:HYR domain-containing protein [Saprospirales bacterium]